MPIYEYHCPKCHKDFEELVFGSDVPACPACGGNACERLMSRPVIHTPTPSKVGQVMQYPSSGKSACGSCAGGNCSSCR